MERFHWILGSKRQLDWVEDAMVWARFSCRVSLSLNSIKSWCEKEGSDREKPGDLQDGAASKGKPSLATWSPPIHLREEVIIHHMESLAWKGKRNLKKVSSMVWAERGKAPVLLGLTMVWEVMCWLILSEPQVFNPPPSEDYPLLHLPWLPAFLLMS